MLMIGNSKLKIFPVKKEQKHYYSGVLWIEKTFLKCLFVDSQIEIFFWHSFKAYLFSQIPHTFICYIMRKQPRINISRGNNHV